MKVGRKFYEKGRNSVEYNWWQLNLVWEPDQAPGFNTSPGPRGIRSVHEVNGRVGDTDPWPGVKLAKYPGLLWPHVLDPVPLVASVLHQSLHDPHPAPVFQPHLLYILHQRKGDELYLCIYLCSLQGLTFFSKELMSINPRGDLSTGLIVGLQTLMIATWPLSFNQSSALSSPKVNEEKFFYKS